jgi:WD40 repeat protein
VRHIIALFCLFAFCVQDVAHAASTLAVAYSEEFSLPVESIEFSRDGKTLVATSSRYAGLYRTDDYTVLDEHRSSEVSILGAGYLDAQTWYFVEFGNGVYAHIRSIASVREIASHRFKHSSNEPVAANGSHIAFSNELLDWKTGQIFPAKIAHFSALGLTLTSNYVVTYNDSWIMMDDPLRRETMAWDTGWSAIARIAMISGTDRVITVSERGACQVWSAPPSPEEKLGNCGRGHFFAPKTQPQLTVSPNGKRLAVSIENHVYVYQITHSEVKLEQEISMPTDVSALALSDKGKLAAGDNNKLVRLWNIGNPQPIGEFNLKWFSSEGNYSNDVSQVAFSPEEHQLAARLGRWIVILELKR